MDSSISHIFGGSEEECHSSESGWTMYIGSPIEDDVDEADNDVEDQYKGGGGGRGGDVESDDSMVSDASSAMAANIKNTNIYHQGAKQDEGDQKKNSRKGKKMGAEKIGNEGKKKDKESTSMNVVSAQSGKKVRRNWLGKKI